MASNSFGTGTETFEEMLNRYRQEMMQYSKPSSAVSVTPSIAAEPLAAVPIESGQQADLGEIADEKEERDTEFARLRVVAQTADGALPVPNADVIVSRYVKGKPTLHQVFYTNGNGETPTITLPAPPEALSEEPGNPTPYAEYVIRVDASGFLPMEFRNVPLFSGVTSIQTALLQPEPENEEYETPKIVYEGNSEVLDPAYHAEGGA